MSHSAAYSDTDSRSSRDVRQTRRAYSYGNVARLADIMLDSHIDKISSDQRRLGGAVSQVGQLSWAEQLAIPLFWNFNANANYRYIDETDRILEDPSGLPDTEVFNRSTS